MIRFIAIDIDGTLLDSRGRLPDVHRDALVAAAERGIAIALVTGRSSHFTRPVAELLPIPLTLIVNNGAVVKDADGTTRLRHLLPRKTARAVLEGTRGFEDSVALVFDRPDDRQIVFDRMDWSHPGRRGYYERNQAFIASAGTTLAKALTDDPIQVMFNGGVAPMRTLIATLREMADSKGFSVTATEYVKRDFSLVDVNGPGCSKGAMLERWTSMCGVSRDEVMAVGDNFNDIEMLDFAGAAFVMGNASDELKTRGYRVTGTNDEGGLAQAIEAACRQ